MTDTSKSGLNAAGAGAESDEIKKSPITFSRQSVTAHFGWDGRSRFHWRGGN